MGPITTHSVLRNQHGVIGVGLCADRSDCHLFGSTPALSAVVACGLHPLIWIIDAGWRASSVLGRLSDLMPIRWSFELLSVTEYNAMKAIRTGLQSADGSSPEGDLRELSATIGFVNESPQTAFLALLIGMGVFMFTTWAALSRKKHSLKTLFSKF